MPLSSDPPLPGVDSGTQSPAGKGVPDRGTKRLEPFYWQRTLLRDLLRATGLTFVLAPLPGVLLWGRFPTYLYVLEALGGAFLLGAAQRRLEVVRLSGAFLVVLYLVTVWIGLHVA